MRVIKFLAAKNERISKQIAENLPECSFSQIMKSIRCKDVKIDGKRISFDQDVTAGSEIIVFLPNDTTYKKEILYEDENLLVANKPRKIETTSESKIGEVLNKDTFQSELEKELKIKLFAVHRLDRNTMGLVIFAKTQEAKESLDFAIKHRQIEKYYVCMVAGKPKISQAHLVAYLKKDKANSRVFIRDTEAEGFSLIETDYKLLKTVGDCSILEVLLVTGKTHQIRAHMAYIGHPIIGDEKYGDANLNKRHKMHFQCLAAKKLVFHFDKDDKLSYLNGKIIELNDAKIDFLSKI